MSNQQANNQQALIQALALVIDHYGYGIRGGKEVFVSDKKLATIPKEAQVQVARHPSEPGYCVRYFPNQTLDIEAIKDEIPAPNEIVKPENP